MRLLLLARKSEAVSLLNILHQERIYYDLLSRVSFLAHSPFSKRIYNGVVIEAELIEECSPDDLATIELLQKVLPCQAIITEPGPAELIQLKAFFETCKRFPPRSVRQQNRSTLSLPALVSTNAEFAEAHTATTYNLSQNGCFLTNPLDRNIGDKIWLNLQGLEDSSPLLSEIRWFSLATSAELPPAWGSDF